jgi:tetratricopeptide (TPR) repeat protein
VANLRRSIELDPQNLRYRTTLAAQLVTMRHYDDAQAEMKRVVEITHGGVLIWKYLALATPYLAQGSTAEGNAFFADIAAAKKEDPEEIDLHKVWARLTGDFALAVRLDEQQPYFDGNGNPRWGQDFQMAVDRLGSGASAEGRAMTEKVLPELKAQLLKEPANSSLWLATAFAEAVLGDREGALAAAAKATELVPESNDAVDGPQKAVDRAQIFAWVGEKDKALSELARLLRVPYGANVHNELHDPGWLPLRDDPRFKALLDDPKNNEPIL